MALTDKFKYNISLKYLKTDSHEYVSLNYLNIEYAIIDRNYDKYNMPMVYLGLNVHYDLMTDMIQNVNKNLINLEIYKFKYDDDNYIEPFEEVYIRDQCTYFIMDTGNNLKITDRDESLDSDQENYVQIKIGLMKISLINDNKKLFNSTFLNTNLSSAIGSVVGHIKDLVLEPLTYGNDILDQISIYKDSVSKSLQSINSVRAFYSTPYRFFMDFDAAYLLSTMGLEVPRRGEKITAVLICIKESKDYAGMDDGMYTNKTQGNYQINVSLDSTVTYTDKTTDKLYNNIMAITSSGDKVQLDLNIDRSAYGAAKTKTIYIPNDNTHLAENIKAQIEGSGTMITLCKESIDTSVLALNHRIIVKHVDSNSDKNGDYIMTSKREMFVRDGSNFILSTIVDLRKVR